MSPKFSRQKSIFCELFWVVMSHTGKDSWYEVVSWGNHESIKLLCQDHKCGEQSSVCGEDLLRRQNFSDSKVNQNLSAFLLTLTGWGCFVLFPHPHHVPFTSSHLHLHYPCSSFWNHFGFLLISIFDVLSSCVTLLASLNYSKTHACFCLPSHPKFSTFFTPLCSDILHSD